MSNLRLIPDVPRHNPEWLCSFVQQLARHRPKLNREAAMQHAAHAFSAMFLLDPTEAAELWDETMTARSPSWSALR
jgi:hypothetical protein